MSHFYIVFTVATMLLVGCQKLTMSKAPHRLDARLRCHNQLHPNPFLRLGPFLVEELNKDPTVIVVHRSAFFFLFFFHSSVLY